MQTVKFSGHECVALENGAIKLLVTQSVGPRILFLSFNGSRNLLAELPDFVKECPGVGAFHFYGGHRLWEAPEALSRTYLPDDRAVEIMPRTGMQKTIEVVLHGEAPRVTITHRLTNRGLWPVTCAPWAITQLRTGGVAILPQVSDDTGVLPNRSLALWPYTDLANPNLGWGGGLIVVQANMEVPFKLGFPNPRGWLAYWLDGNLFVKRVSFDPQGTYADFGSSNEFYSNQQFLELETLAPMGTIPPGSSAVHVETWELYADIDRPRTVNEAQSLVETLGLG
jgi:hypothetical protein